MWLLDPLLINNSIFKSQAESRAILGLKPKRALVKFTPQQRYSEIILFWYVQVVVYSSFLVFFSPAGCRIVLIFSAYCQGVNQYFRSMVSVGVPSPMSWVDMDSDS